MRSISYREITTAIHVHVIMHIPINGLSKMDIYNLISSEKTHIPMNGLSKMDTYNLISSEI